MRRNRTSLIAGVIGVVAVAAAIPAASAALHATQTISALTCTRSQLSVRDNGTNGAAGTIHGAWVFKNVSGTSCHLDGYPDLQLYGVSGRPIRTVVRHMPPAPVNVTLAPGASATFFSSFSDVSSGPPPCPVSAVAQITAPDVGASLFIPAELAPCRGVVNVSAVVAGVHPA